ncbi:single-stranded DNA-binding protein [Streptomyces sp. NPDC006711]|uniref:single-stranded DNA-binding protein n=1 Tax=Streptomyces sp. NPDC006711 TaxID=3364762 RepID=UPI00369C87BD
MNETMVTLVGNVATQVEWRETPTGGAARLRLAVSARRFDREKQCWVDGVTSFYTVWAARTLGKNLTGSVAVGEPLLVHGRLKVRDEEREDGSRRFSADVDAVAIGHDMTRGTSAFRRVFKGEAAPAERAVRQGELSGAGPGPAAGASGTAGAGEPGGALAGAVSGGAVGRGAPVVWESVSATVSDTVAMGF